MAQNVQNSAMFRKLSYYTVVMGVITRTLHHGVISPSTMTVRVTFFWQQLLMCDASATYTRCKGSYTTIHWVACQWN